MLKYLFCSLTVFTVFFNPLKANEPRLRLGKVTVEELSNTRCPFDPDASAYYIFDEGETRIDYDNSRQGQFILKFTRKSKI